MLHSGLQTFAYIVSGKIPFDITVDKAHNSGLAALVLSVHDWLSKYKIHSQIIPNTQYKNFQSDSRCNTAAAGNVKFQEVLLYDVLRLCPQCSQYRLKRR